MRGFIFILSAHSPSHLLYICYLTANCFCNAVSVIKAYQPEMLAWKSLCPTVLQVLVVFCFLFFCIGLLTVLFYDLMSGNQVKKSFLNKNLYTDQSSSFTVGLYYSPIDLHNFFFNLRESSKVWITLKWTLQFFFNHGSHNAKLFSHIFLFLSPISYRKVLGFSFQTKVTHFLRKVGYNRTFFTLDLNFVISKNNCYI